MLARVDRRRRIAGLGALIGAGAAGVVLLFAVSSPTRASVGRCGPAGAQTLASDKVARVYATGNAVYGCATGAGRSFRLGARRSCVGTSRAGPVFALAGRLAGYGVSRCGIDTGFTQVVVRRLSDGAQLRSLPATGVVGPESYQGVGSLVLRADGGVAWIGTGSSIVGGRKLIEVRKADRGGVALLDSGPAVDSGSLRLHGSKLTWKHGGRVRSASLQ
jgi:hypothetical protein